MQQSSGIPEMVNVQLVCDGLLINWTEEHVSCSSCCWEDWVGGASASGMGRGDDGLMAFTCARG